MTMKIEITVPEDEIKAGNSAGYLEKAMWAFGYGRMAMATRPNETYAEPDMSEVLPDEGPNYAAMKEAAEQAEAPKRERGKPSPGKARRTKEEIAEDEAADKADAAAAPAEPKPAISTGEERIDPTNPDDAKQDAADEAAEVASAPELTHDDVRAALKKYVDAYGMPAAMEDGPKVFKLLFGDSVVKVSDIPTDHDSLKRAVEGVHEMLAKNPYKREANL